MAIDPTIALKVNSPNMIGAYVRGMELQNALANRRITQAEQEQQNQLKALLDSGFDLRSKEAPTELLKYGKAGADLSGRIDEQRKAELTRAKELTDLFGKTATFVSANPQFAQQALMRFGEATGEDMSDELAELQSLGGDPEAVRKWAAGYALEAKELMPTFDEYDLGGTRETVQRDPLTGKVISSERRTKTMAPGEAERIGLERRRVELAERGEGAGATAPTLTEIVDPTNAKQMLRVDAKTYRGGGIGSPGVFGVSGKEPVSASKDLQSDEGRKSVDDQVANLRDLYTRLQQGGGITDTTKGAMSNLGAGTASTGLGQATGRLFGTQNQSLRNQITQMRPLLLQAIKNATGMSAKQMDSNVELKMYLAAATDPTLDVQANLSALSNLSKLYGLGEAIGPGDAGSTAPEGIDPAVWNAMTPEERALWQN